MGKPCEMVFMATVDGRMQRIGTSQQLDTKDVNSMQEFTVTENNMKVDAVKLVFNASTDFYGRVVVYRLVPMGTLLD